MSASLERSATDRRGFFRVQTRVRLGLRPVTPEEVAGLRSEILQREPSPRPKVDPGLADWLTRIEEKLDQLLHDAGRAAPGALRKQEHSVVLSGSGLLLPNVEATRELGSTLLLEFDLPLCPRHAVRCLAVVAGNRPDADGRPALALGFCCIHEEDRDAIVRHTLVVERRSFSGAA